MKIWTVNYKGATTTIKEGTHDAFSFLLCDFLKKTWDLKPTSREWAFDIMAKSAMEVANVEVVATAYIDFNRHVIDIR